MGQAKRRGPRDERVAQAMARAEADQICEERQRACAHRMRRRYEIQRRQQERWERLFPESLRSKPKPPGRRLSRAEVAILMGSAMAGVKL